MSHVPLGPGDKFLPKFSVPAYRPGNPVVIAQYNHKTLARRSLVQVTYAGQWALLQIYI